MSVFAALLAVFTASVESYYIYTTDVIAEKSTSPIELPLSYSFSQIQTLQCTSTAFSDATIVTTDTSGSVNISVTTTTTTADSYSVSCSSGSLVSDSVLVLVESTSNIVTDIVTTVTPLVIKASVSVSSGTLICSCGTVLTFPVYTISSAEDSFSLTPSSSSCTSQTCSCELSCSFSANPNLDLTEEITVWVPQIHLTPKFASISQYHAGYYEVFIYPFMTADPTITCSVAAVEVVDYSTTVDGTVTNLPEIEGTTVTVSKPYPAEGSYQLSCSAPSVVPASFVFEYRQGVDSSLSGPAVDLTGYIDVPCGCDVISGFCDWGCGCDTDCSTEQIEAFVDKLTGAIAGDLDVSISPLCSTLNFLTPLEKALCVRKSNSAYLGQYFHYSNQTAESDSYYRGTGIEDVPQSSTVGVGNHILTHTPFATGFLSLPGSLTGSLCVPVQPVRLFESREGRCKVEVRCDSNSLLHPTTYLTPTSPEVNPALRFIKVYKNEQETTSVPVSVRYYKSSTPITHLTSTILKDTTCLYSVTSVTYTLAMSDSDITDITADIELNDLSGDVGSKVVVDYKVDFQMSHDVTTQTVPSAYDVGDEVVVTSGILDIPTLYGDCGSVAKDAPKLGISTIFQCRSSSIAFATCPDLYSTLLAQYTSIISNSSEILPTPDAESPITILETSPLNTTGLDLCNYLPSRVIITAQYYNMSDGYNITSITYKLEHGDVMVMVGDTYMVSGVMVWREVLGDSERCQVGWCRGWEYVTSTQGLFNTLLLVLAGTVYALAPSRQRFGPKF